MRLFRGVMIFVLLAGLTAIVAWGGAEIELALEPAEVDVTDEGEVGEVKSDEDEGHDHDEDEGHDEDHDHEEGHDHGEDEDEDEDEDHDA